MLKAASHVKAITDSSGSVLLDLRSGTYYSLNGVASDFWSGLVDGLAADDMVARISQKYSAPAARVATDLQSFVQHLDAMGLIDGER
jgi:hypothetical protein